MSGEPTEPTYASDLKEWIGQIIKEHNLPFGKVKVEMMKERKRADILFLDDKNNCVFLIEVKRPEKMEAPYDPKVMEQTLEYVEKYRPHIRHFATHNVNFLVLWDAVTLKKIDQFAITYIKELQEYFRKTDEIRDSFRRFLLWYNKFLQGESPKPIDESIVEILHNYIRGIVNTTRLVNKLVSSYVDDPEFRLQFEVWLADNGWEDPKGDKEKLEEYCTVLAKQYTYLFINKVLFYNVLKQRYALPELTLPKGLEQDTFYTFLQTFFNVGIKKSKNYETVFQTNFVDKIPIPPDTISELIRTVHYLQALDYSTIGYDIIGKVFEKLIPVEERHTLGQYFTRSDVVDLIIGFCVKDPKGAILDPACGSGTFLVRSYYRLKYLEGKKSHKDLLEQLWGIDIAKFPAHLSTINLAIRDLSVEENYPSIIYEDFFEIFPRSRVKIGVQHTLEAFGIPRKETSVKVSTLDKSVTEKKMPLMNAIVGNPPYTRQEEMLEEVFGHNYKKETLLPAIQKDFHKANLPLTASIYAYFFIHGLKFLEENRRLGFITLRSWLDVGYGKALKNFFLRECKIVAIIESKEERWFPEAQMLPCISILETCDQKKDRDENLVKFVQLKQPLSAFVPSISDEHDMIQEIYRWKEVDECVTKIEHAEELFPLKEIEFLDQKIWFYENEIFRIVLVRQQDLKDDSKWGKFLVAPSTFFKVLERARNLVVPLQKVADVKYAIKTGANEFFCLPNRFFDTKETNDFLVLIDKGTKKERFWIEWDYVEPVLNKIKPHKSISNLKKDGYLLMCKQKKSGLKRAKKKILDYIEYGENKEHVCRRKRYSGYHERPTCASRKPWYSLDDRPKSLIISPSIYWGRHIVFFNKSGLYATDCLDEIRPLNAKYGKALCALLNSTLTALFTEFSGRYIENRDKTISNEIKIYELKQVPMLDPQMIGKKKPRLIGKLEQALDEIANSEVKPLFEEIELKERQALDEIVFCDILGLTRKEMIDICRATGSLYKARIERLAEK